MPYTKSPIWEANNFPATNKISHILWNLKVQYCVHKSPPPTCPYHEPDQSPTPSTSSTLIYLRPILLLSSQLHLGLSR